MHQAHAMQEIHPSIQREANEMGAYVIPGGQGRVTKDFYNGEPMAYLTFSNEGDGKFCGYKITKNQISKMAQTNVNPPENIGRKLERLAYKIQKTELPDLGGENEL
jgi:hypothetical protein